MAKQFFAQGEAQSGTNYYYLLDQLGSIREVLDSSGAIHAEYSYDPYGNMTKASGGNLDATFQYAGYYAHLGSGLNFTFRRAYDPVTGRWLSRDPIGEDGGINLYEYSYNEPINNTDPMGLTCIKRLAAVFTSAYRVGDDGIYKSSGRQFAGTMASYDCSGKFIRNYHIVSGGNISPGSPLAHHVDTDTPIPRGNNFTVLPKLDVKGATHGYDILGTGPRLQLMIHTGHVTTGCVAIPDGNAFSKLGVDMDDTAKIPAVVHLSAGYNMIDGEPPPNWIYK